jgi:hypothetical protein
MKNGSKNESRTNAESKGIVPLTFRPSSDISEYYKIKSQVFNLIDELKNEGISDEKIISTLCEKTDVSNDLIKFFCLIHIKN